MLAATPTVAASLALACLQSVPNKKEPQKLVKSLKALGLPAELTGLAEGPSSVLHAPCRRHHGGFDNISRVASDGGFKNEVVRAGYRQTHRGFP